MANRIASYRGIKSCHRHYRQAFFLGHKFTIFSFLFSFFSLEKGTGIDFLFLVAVET